MNEKELLKSEDCLYCICIECNQKFNTDIERCSYSDCKWCKDEMGQYTETCRLYIDKGGSYERR
mgnify:CR=1 FL=1